MRYENWDVLLFPENSKVPIQEFKTQCFVTKDEGSYLQFDRIELSSFCLGTYGLAIVDVRPSGRVTLPP